MITTVSDHVLGQVATAELTARPWPHAHLPHALPAELALRLSRSFDGLDMAFFEQTGTAKSYRLRTAALTADTARALGTDWQQLRDVLAGQAYRDHVGELTGVPLEDSTCTLDLWEYRTGDWLAPHVDKPEKLVTQIFYLTEGWRPDDGGQLHVLATADPASVVRTLPPLLGSSAILVRSETSWHAVAAPGPHSPARRSVAATFWQRGGPAPRPGQ
jgi:Rps23 Pro-64 3,4-dihydroxylase Tpa1-like proline 4-hydroxylase